MYLPEELDEEFWQEIQYKEKKLMPYLTGLERRAIKRGLEQGIEQGMKQGLLEGIGLGLELKFGEKGLELMPEIQKIDDINILKAIHSGIKSAKSLDELHQIYQEKKL